MSWTDILKNPRKPFSEEKTKVINITWEEDREGLPDSYMIPNLFMKTKSKALEYLSKKFKAKALGYDEYDFF